VFYVSNIELLNFIFYFTTVSGDVEMRQNNDFQHASSATQNGKIYTFSFISSPELKAQVSYSDRLLSVVRLSVCLSVCL
jgi:hypothetical protein